MQQRTDGSSGGNGDEIFALVLAPFLPIQISRLYLCMSMRWFDGVAGFDTVWRDSGSIHVQVGVCKAVDHLLY